MRIAVRSAIAVAIACTGIAQAQTEILPVCHRTVIRGNLTALTFAHCTEDRGSSVRGVLRGGAGVNVSISEDSQMLIITRVDSVDMSRQRETESVTVSEFGSMREGVDRRSTSIELSEVPAWALDFVQAHRAALEPYRNLGGYRSVQKLLAEQDRRTQQAQREQAQQEQARAAQAAQQQQQAEQARAQEQAALRTELASLDAGQLFARADELRSQGRIEGARVALRLLLSKFSGHALAAPAAQQLAQLASQGGDATAAAGGGAATASAGGAGSTGGSASAANVDVCASPRVPDFIAQKWARFSRPGMRKVYDDTVKPFDVAYAQDSRKASRSQLLQDIRANLANWRSQQPVAADNYCKMSAGCTDGAALARTWPAALPANLPNPQGPSTLESMAGAYVAMGIGIDYYALYEKYLMCPGR